MRQLKNYTRAFTLVEIVIIAGVLCSGLFIVVQVAVPGFEAQRKAQIYSLMSILTQSLIEEIKLEGYEALSIRYPGNSYGKSQGKFKDYPHFSWQVEWWQTEVPNLRKLKVRVWAESEKEGTTPEITIVTYLARR